MSDQLIAEATGLGSTTVAAIRQGFGSRNPQPAARIGKDGKVHPLDSTEGRQRAAALIRERPESSLREVARSVGISLATASDVRRRLERGEEPVPSRSTERSGKRSVERVAKCDPVLALRKLLRDPSLRYCQTGRQLLLLLQYNANAGRKWADVIISVPPHCRPVVRQLARHYAQMWTDLEQKLSEMARQSSADPSNT